MINIIVAVDEEFGIGYDQNLLFTLNPDMDRFKFLTLHNEHQQQNLVVMGRHTYQSLKKKLPNRINVVISRNKSFEEDGVIVESNLDKVLRHHKQSDNTKQELFVIGGQRIFNESIEYVDRIYLTKIHQTSKYCDTYFNKELLNGFEVESEDVYFDEESGLTYSFINYVRKGNSYGEK